MKNWYKRFGKRILDVTIVAIALVLLSPVIVAVALVILFVMGRPVIFRQARLGLHGKPFIMYKFRTMTEEHDENGNLLPDEKRLTRLGAWLRSWSLDELPELFNVLKGDMSLVGPRPLLMEYLKRYTLEQFRRHEVKPGITGWAQVNGRNALSWEEKFKLDVWYVNNLAFWLDLKILFLTLRNVLKRQGISAPGHVTMPEFLRLAKSTGNGENLE
ncbi:MAG: sugar transferase [Candidatus Caldatribacteriaceae bacterium]